jgi:hypothetical protein
LVVQSNLEFDGLDKVGFPPTICVNKECFCSCFKRMVSSLRLGLVFTVQPNGANIHGSTAVQVTSHCRPEILSQRKNLAVIGQTLRTSIAAVTSTQYSHRIRTWGVVKKAVRRCRSERWLTITTVSSHVLALFPLIDTMSSSRRWGLHLWSRSPNEATPNTSNT